MKKKYLNPKMVVVEINPEEMIAGIGSGGGFEGETPITPPGEEGGAVKEQVTWPSNTSVWD